MGCRPGATLLPESTIWELVAYVESIAHPPSATFGRTISRTPPSPAVEQTPAEFLQTPNPWSFTSRLQRRPKASRRVTAMGLARLTIVSTAVCAGVLDSLSRRRVSDGHLARRRPDGETNSAVDAGSVDRLRHRRRHYRGPCLGRDFATRTRRRRRRNPD